MILSFHGSQANQTGSHPVKPAVLHLVSISLFLLLILPGGFTVSRAQDSSTESTPADSATVAAAVTDSLFAIWTSELQLEAATKGISEATFNSAFSGISLLPRVIELDRNQPEFTLTFEQYLQRVAPASRVKKGRRLLAENRALLARIKERFNVPPRVIVALWGIETDFGRIQGGFNIVEALATLAFDGRRSTYFRTELFHALQILEEGHITAPDFKGSWAGAMGQCQFMPSSFINHAIDFNNDGRRNIWQTREDVFASAANYLAKSGWNGTYIWGRPVTLPDDFTESLSGTRIRKSLLDWQALGVRKADGSSLPSAPGLMASVVLPDGLPGPAFLVYDNYEVILKWNRSTFFATTVGILSDRIGGLYQNLPAPKE